VPKGFEEKFNEGKLPIHKVVRYTDYSLKHFFKTASKSAWYNNTIFVISADHCNQSYLPEYNSSVGNHAIPIIFFEPGNRAKINLDSTLTQQIDIMPRLLRELNYSGDILSFGNDPVTDKSPFVVNFSGNTWEFMQGNYLLRFRNEKTTGLFNYKKDRLLKKNLISHPPVNIKPMLQKLKAFIQQYKNRLIENRLTPFE
jgi:phosphoglycerol transferase MdoB-like AlkP superfamily enzyme